jgi:hypothetical protein
VGRPHETTNLFVISATSSPLPPNAANTSMPSSILTVLSTSKQTAPAPRRISLTSSGVCKGREERCLQEAAV